jgi:hypothetical protein
MKFHHGLQIVRLFCLITVFQLMLGCGVKGDPMPPLSPAVLGHGEPTYQKATEKIKIKKRDKSEKKKDAVKDGSGEDPEWEELDFVEDNHK